MNRSDGKEAPLHKTPARKNIIEASYGAISKFIARFFLKTPITPNQLTIFSGILGIIAAVLLTFHNTFCLILGGILIQLFLLLDAVDGDLARMKNMCSTLGQWLDSFFDKINDFCMITGLSLGVYFRTGKIYALYLGIFLMGMQFLIQFFMLYNNTLDRTRPATKGASENISYKHNSYLLKKVYTFLMLHFSMGGMTFWCFLSLFAFINKLFFGLVFLSIYSLITFILLSGGYLYKLYNQREVL